jgi:hypothetical protein
VTDRTLADLQQLQADYRALLAKFQSLSRRHEGNLANAIALEDTHRQIYAQLLAWLQAGDFRRAAGFLEDRLATMEADRKRLGG